MPARLPSTVTVGRIQPVANEFAARSCSSPRQPIDNPMVGNNCNGPQELTGDVLRFTLLMTLEHFARAVVPGSAHNAAARMGARSAQEKPLDRRPISSPTGHRPHHEHLV